jgi:hypothetical protein
VVDSAGQPIILTSLEYDFPSVQANIPNCQRDFPEHFSPYDWPSSSGLSTARTTFLSVVESVLRKRNCAFEPQADPDELNPEKARSFLATPYIDLSIQANPQALGRVSVCVSFPYNVTGGTFEYHVRYVAKEGRLRSDTWSSSPDRLVEDQAKAFVAGIEKDLQTEKPTSP